MISSTPTCFLPDLLETTQRDWWLVLRWWVTYSLYMGLAYVRWGPVSVLIWKTVKIWGSIRWQVLNWPTAANCSLVYCIFACWQDKTLVGQREAMAFLISLDISIVLFHIEIALLFFSLLYDFVLVHFLHKGMSIIQARNVKLLFFEADRGEGVPF